MAKTRRKLLTLLAALLALPFAAAPASAQSSFYKDKWGINEDHGIRPWPLFGPTAAARASEAGFTWVRYTFYWNLLNPNPDNPATPQIEGFDWASSDTTINDLTGTGLQIYGNIMWAPDWAVQGTPGYKPFQCMDPNTITFVATNPGCDNRSPDVAAVKAFVREAVLRYGNRIRYWGFWNEPNYQIFWHSASNSTQRLNDVVDLMIIPGGEAARAANPNVLIVGPDVDDPVALKIILQRDQQYLQQKGRRLFDVISFHQYAPDIHLIPGGDMSQIGAQFDRYNTPDILGTYRASRPLWLTESYATKDSMGELFRAIDQRPWIDRFAYYGFKSISCQTPNSDPACNTSTTSGTPPPTTMVDLLGVRLPPFYAAKHYLRGTQLFTNQTPATNSSAIPGYEVATQLSSSRQGMIKALRFWRAPGESGNNTLRLWTDTGAQLAAATLVDNGTGASGWREVAIAPVQIQAGTRYLVSVNTNTAQSKTTCGIGSGITSGPLTAHSGFWGQPMGAMPANGSCSNFFVDVTFEPGVRIFTVQTPTTTASAAPGYEVATQFSATRSGAVKALRFWRAAGETGDTVVRLWTDSGQLLTSATYRNYGTAASGWQQLAIPPVPITANTRYRVSFNTNTSQAKTACGIGSGITQGPLTAWAGFWGQPIGSMPTNGSCSNFFADVVLDW